MIDLNDNNQNIFIKRGPEIFDSKEAEELSKQVEDDMIEHPGLMQDPYMKILADKVRRLSKQKGAVDYSGCENFWIAKEQTGQKITLVEQGSAISLTEEFDNIEALEEKFIDLHEFLDEAKYVGKFFRRTKSIEGDTGYMQGDVLVLFATDSNMLAMETSFGTRKYKMIKPKYFIDGNFEFYGSVNPEFDNKEDLIKDINKQINNSNDKTL